jgi:hypothetical protein
MLSAAGDMTRMVIGRGSIDEQPGQQAQPQYSQDGKWWWDGQNWVAVQQQARGGPPAGVPGSAKRRRGPGLWIGLAMGLVVLMGICTVAVANSGSSSRSSAKTSAAPAATAPTAAKSATAAAPARDGSCAPQPCANDNYGWIATISNLRYGAQASQFEQPEAGNVFVMVDVTFANKLDQEQHANPTEFVLMDGAAIKHTWRPLAEGCATWEPVNLTKGATLGPKCLSFEAAAGKPSPLTLVWTPTGFGGGYSIKLS